jgi:hypothetical protein
MAERTGTSRYSPDLWRLEAELRVAAGDAVGDAAPPLEHALRMARGLDSRALELRALVSQARLFPDDDDVRADLGRALAAFTEGSETPDLRDGFHLLRPR